MCIAFAAELSSLASVILIKIAFFFRYSCYAGQIIFWVKIRGEFSTALCKRGNLHNSAQYPVDG